MRWGLLSWWEQKNKIIKETQHLLDNQESYHKMSRAINPYGDGRAAQKIVDILLGKSNESRDNS